MLWQAASKTTRLCPHSWIHALVWPLFTLNQSCTVCQVEYTEVTVLNFQAQVIKGIDVSILVFGSLTVGRPSCYTVRALRQHAEAHVRRK